MRVDTLLINIMSAFLASLYIIYFQSIIRGLKLSKNVNARFSIIFALLNGIVSSLLHMSVYKPVVLLLLSTVMIMVLLKTGFIQAFLSFSLYIIGLAIGNAFIPLIISVLSPGTSVEQVVADPLMALAGNLFTNLIVFLLFVLIKPIKDYIKMLTRDKFLLILTAVTIVVITSTFAMYLYTMTLDIVACLIISSISISYCVFIILMWIASLRRVIRDEDLKHQKFYNESLRSTLFELRRFKHDWINNLTVIDSMLKMSKIAELKQYVSELIGHCWSHTNTQIYSIKNAALFGILSSKVNLAHEKGISVNMSVAGEMENISGIKISDFCEIIGIFMDNAIEEASVSDSVINIDMREGDNFIEISISNTCTTTPDMQKLTVDGYSTKGEGRGMGLAIAEKIISRYRNILHITTYENNMFTQTIEILKTEKKGE
ncbi:MAG TPA: GHKL domain-containing protein [Clostridiales bacterium]|nr:GHKL domain-containing protein [Clostridiales bacterium]HPZ05725.1 GHKL domain-containing protein [Clostridiales bacterium]HQD30614.1 GHKL domain-containing protein [Clostridiales bacterium]